MPKVRLNQKKNVAVAIPIYREELTPDEEISLRHLRHFLGAYDKYFVIPDNLKMKNHYDDFSVKRFDNKKFFGSKTAHNRLLLSERFYRSFDGYEYILLYHPDCLVFSDRLVDWCNKGYDYVGAPWYKKELAKAGLYVVADRDCVGNGGFSLRKRESFLRVLNAYKNLFNISGRVARSYPKPFGYFLSGFLRQVVRKRNFKSIFRTINNHIGGNISYQYNEDVFWSLEAKKYCPDFRIPPPEIAVSFSFEVGPRYCFEKNNRSLPLGCHGWDKNDRGFWESYILK